MVLLGISDGLHASAALVVDDQVVAVESEDEISREPATRGLPWDAVRAVLDEAGLRTADVDCVAIAGRFTPPLFLRRHPRLRRVAGEDAFSPAMDAHVFAQAMLRQSGFGAYEEDRVAQWFEHRLGHQGFADADVRMIDIHRCLAEAAYRCQPDDDLLICSAHPKGDGVSFAVHQGLNGQLERLWSQKGYSALHVHLQRCAAAIGFSPLIEERLMWGAAAKGVPDAGLVEQLRGHLRAVGPGFSRRPYPLPDTPGLWRNLGRADRSVAAASVLENLRTATLEVVRHHVARTGAKRVALAGLVFDNPRLVADIAAGLEATVVLDTPPMGWDALAVGAACTAGGPAPARLPVMGLRRRTPERRVGSALRALGVQATRLTSDELVRRVAAELADGKSVGVFGARGGWGWTGLCTRSVLVRADDASIVDRVRTALQRSPDEEVGCAWLPDPDDGAVQGAGESPYGLAAIPVDARFAQRYAGAVTWDGRAHLQRVREDDVFIGPVLAELRRLVGCGAVAVLPLAERSDPLPVVPGDAIRTWRRCGLDVLVAGAWMALGQ